MVTLFSLNTFWILSWHAFTAAQCPLAYESSAPNCLVGHCHCVYEREHSVACDSCNDGHCSPSAKYLGCKCRCRSPNPSHPKRLSQRTPRRLAALLARQLVALPFQLNSSQLNPSVMVTRLPPALQRVAAASQRMVCAEKLSATEASAPPLHRLHPRASLTSLATATAAGRQVNSILCCLASLHVL